MKDRRYRLPIGALLVASVVGIVLWDRSAQSFLIGPVICVLLGFLALVEFVKVAGDRILKPVGRMTLVSGILIGVAALVPSHLDAARAGWQIGAASLLGTFLIALGLLWARLRVLVAPSDFPGAALAVSGLLMTILPMALLSATMRFHTEGILYALVVVIGSKLNDMGGYLIGSTLGRNKLCPGISPNKTYEGSIGGALLGILGTVLITRFSALGDHVSMGTSLVLGCLLAVTTQAGDLFESAYKRSMGVKDSAALIPAFGGILDLVDSFIFAAPLGYTLAWAWLAF